MIRHDHDLQHPAAGGATGGGSLSALGGRRVFGRQTYGDWPDYIRAMLQVKKACALTNAAVQALDPTRACAIAEACDELMERPPVFALDTLMDAAPLLNAMINAAVAERGDLILAGKGAARKICPDRHVNMSQGFRDVTTTADMLFIHARLARILAALPELEEALGNKAAEFRGRIKMGRLDLQDSLPIGLEQVFNGYLTRVGHARTRLETELARWNVSRLGATFIGTGFGCLPGFREEAHKYLSRVCGRQLAPCTDFCAALQESENYVLAHAHIECVALALAGIAKDLMLMTSGPNCGLGDVRIPAAQPGSSIMPGKVNPVLPEMILQIGYKISANQAGVAQAAYDGELESGCDASMIRKSIHASSEMLANAIPLFASKVIAGIQAGRACDAVSLNTSWPPFFLALRALFGEKAAYKAFRQASTRRNAYADVLRRKEFLSHEDVVDLFEPATMVDVEKSAAIFAKYLHKAD